MVEIQKLVLVYGVWDLYVVFAVYAHLRHEPEIDQREENARVAFPCLSGGLLRTDGMATLRIVCCSAPEDKKLMEGLRAHLRMLEIRHASIWYTHNTLPGAQWQRERDRQLQSAHLILFLVSSDFLNSREHYEQVLLPAMERYRRGEIQIIPIILRPADWRETSFGKLQPLPEGGKPVIDSGWETQDHAFLNVVHGIRRVLDEEMSRILARQENDDILLNNPEESTPAASDSDAAAQLEQIIQGFQALRKQIASAVLLKGPPGFSIGSGESQYTRLYGDAMVFLATYLPQLVSGEGEGFVEAVYKNTRIPLQRRNNFSVWLARRVITPLAELERLAAQIDACVATLESYKQDIR